MALDFDKICVEYDKLASGAPACWEVYAGERAEALAKEKCIPAGKWVDDSMAMQLGREALAYELDQGIPQTPEEREKRLRWVISRQINRRLGSQSSDTARRGMLLQALQAGDAVNEAELAALSRLDLETLQDELIDRVLAWTIEKVLPVMRTQCEMLMLDGDQKTVALDNPGALAVAGYLTVPEIRDMPGVVGACGEVVSCCQADSSPADVIGMAAFALLIVAAFIATASLLQLGTVVLGEVVVQIVMEGTMVGISASIASEVALISEFVIGGLKLALGVAAVSGLMGLLGQFIRYETDGLDTPVDHTPSLHNISIT